MKIEKLSDKQIRFHISRSDLDRRGIKMSEFAYGSDRAKSLFRELMLWAEYKLNFVAHDMPLMIEAVPSDTDAIALIVTKLDPQEAEAYQKIGRSSASLPGHGGGDDSNPPSTIRQFLPPGLPAEETALFAFDRLEDLLSFAAKVPDPDQVSSSLYRDSERRVLYLILGEKASAREAFSPILALAGEYGSLLHVPKLGIYYMEERFECTLAEDALRKLRETG